MKSRCVIDQIRKLKNGGHSIKKIAEILKISKNTVRRYLRGGIQVSEAKPTDKDVGPDWMNSIDWEGICAKRKQGYSVKQLYSDYEPAISYNRFGVHSFGKLSEKPLKLPLDCNTI